jgi:tripartite-type tricarboxylate transporter receptor subunit TctC
VVVENKPGAGGRLVAEALKNSDPASPTYMVGPNATGLFQSLLYPASVLKYDYLNDLAPVAMIASYPLGMAVSNKIGVSNAKEYVSWLKANPKEALFGSAGLGGHTHFTGLQLGKAAGVPMTVVPYKGNGPLMTDLIGGQVPAGILVAGDFLQHQKSGQLKVIGIFSSKRSPLAPDVPTFIEQGYDIDAGDAWIGMWASAKAPKAEVARMQDAVQKVLAMSDVRETLTERLKMNPDFRPSDELARVQRKEIEQWRPIVKASGFTPDQ